MNNFNLIAFLIPTLVVGIGAGLLGRALENRMLDYISKVYPNTSISQDISTLAPDDEQLVQDRRSFFAASNPLRKTDPTLDKWCRQKKATEVVTSIAMVCFIGLVLVGGLARI